MRECTEEMFLKDVEKHEMSILLDSGIYRHLRFRAPNTSNQWFEIVTWPGSLAYTGDMGAFVFERLEDMFQFFRTANRGDNKLEINLSYWSEKLEAVDNRCHHPGSKQFDPDRFRARVEEQLGEWRQELEEDEDYNDLCAAVKDEVLARIDDGENDVRIAVRDFTHKLDAGRRFEFHDSWEWDCEEYTFRFIWCCYAIAWAIKKYDTK